MTALYWSDFVPNSTFYRILRGFHREFATGVACRQGTLTPPDSWSCPIWDLQMFFCWYHWHSIINYTTNSRTFPWFEFLLNLTLLNKSFNRVYATGVACWQGTLTPPDTWSRLFGTCICSTCWDQSFFRYCLYFPDYALRISLGTFSILLCPAKLNTKGEGGCSRQRMLNSLHHCLLR